MERVILLQTEGNPPSPGFTCVSRPKWRLLDLLKAMQELSEGYDNIFYFYADCPFLDAELTGRMIENHQRYFADYTFADGYPYGLSPEIIRPKMIAPIISLASSAGEQGEAVGRGSIFDIIKKDINAFDIETEISPVDLRMLRVTLAADSKRNFLLLQRVVQNLDSAGPAPVEAEAVCEVLQEKSEILRTLPAFFSIQIVKGCPQLCSYCPYPQFSLSSTGKKDEMPLSKFRSLVEKIEEFCEDAVINISLWGEPAYHSQIVELVRTVLDRDALRLIIETSGIGWDSEKLPRIAGLVNRSPDWVVSLDANTAEIYGRLRGPQFEEALRTLDILTTCFPGHVYPQAVRMKSNEEDLEGFYRQWKEKLGLVIIQKYDHFCGFLPELKVTDLSPLKRLPCWHLKRDLYVYMDGSVPLCREDIEGKYFLGNLFSDGLEEELSKIERKVKGGSVLPGPSET
ncbi:hypothetical protein ES703_121265 [subsurface metagenome]